MSWVPWIPWPSLIANVRYRQASLNSVLEFGLFPSYQPAHLSTPPGSPQGHLHSMITCHHHGNRPPAEIVARLVARWRVCRRYKVLISVPAVGLTIFITYNVRELGYHPRINWYAGLCIKLREDDFKLSWLKIKIYGLYMKTERKLYILSLHMFYSTYQAGIYHMFLLCYFIRLINL